MKRYVLAVLILFGFFKNSFTQSLTSMEGGNDGIYIDFGDINSLEGTNQFTYNFWIKADTVGTGTGSEVIPIMTKWYTSQSPSTCSWGLFLIDDFLQFNVSDGNTSSFVAFERNFLLNEWNFISIIFNSGVISYYINGQLIEIQTLNITSINDCNESFKIADWYSIYDQNYSTFDGNLDEISIWNTVLDSAEISNIMNCKPDNNDPNLLGYWDFEENTGINVNDFSSRRLL